MNHLFQQTLLLTALIFSGFAFAGDLADHSRMANKTETATFAGGCFWCMQHPFDEYRGVIATTVGYTGGHTEKPSYEQVSAGGTGHAESVEILFDPSRVTYSELLNIFWHQIDPTTLNRQFADIGDQYRTAIFFHNESQRIMALASLQKFEKTGVFGKPIVTEIVAASTFYRAEEYHQKYYNKNPIRYKFYRLGSGRDQYLKRIWRRVLEP